MTAELVSSRGEGEVTTLSLDSGANRNALSEQLLKELLEALQAAMGDPGTRVVVLTHSGDVFSSGADLRQQQESFLRTGASPGAGGLVPVLRLLLGGPKPVVCRIDGAVRGGGMGLLAASDAAISSQRSSFAFSEVRVGVAPAVIAPPVLAKVPRAMALELFLSGRVFPAAEALAASLLNRVVAPGELDQSVADLVGQLLRAAPGAQAEAKGLLARHALSGMEAEFGEMVELSRRLFSGAEAQEGIAAFLERRPPRWLL